MKKNLLFRIFLLSVSVQFCNGQCTPFIQAIPSTVFPCHNMCNGKLIINPALISGTPPYSFTSNFGWVIQDSPNPGWTTITDLCAGQNVIVNISDAAGCTGQDQITMIEPAALNPTITVTPACGSTFTGTVSITGIPDWYWKRSVAVTTSNTCDYIWNSWFCSGVINGADLYPSVTTFVLDGLYPGNYYFGISFEMTEYQSPWLGCTQYIPFTVSSSLPSALITPSGPTIFCSGGSVVLNAPAGINKTYQWKKGANLISGATLSSYTATTGGNYRVIVTNTITGCSKTSNSATAVTVNALPAATITPQGPTTFCAGGSVVLAANTGTGLTYKWKKNGNFISGATLSNYTVTTGGNYRVQVTNSNGCSKVSGLVAVSVPCREGEIISSANNLDFNVYPNPNSGEFTIKFSTGQSDPVQIEMTDEIGKIVKKFETSDETVVIKELNLAKGIYWLTARNKNEMVKKKISVVK